MHHHLLQDISKPYDEKTGTSEKLL